MNPTISTGRVSNSYEVIDTIFAIDSHKEGFWSGAADPNKAFEGVKKQLQKKCEQLGGDAFQDCLFEYRVALADGLLSKKQVMEIFAYGTVVKLK
jgi:hypothetical protein